jgi:hypothetical protein
MLKVRTLDDLLAGYSSDVRTLAQAARAFMLDLIPGAEETVDGSGPYVSYGYGPGYKGMVAGMSISKAGVKLLFPGGPSLADPHQLLEGAGKTHKHVPLKTADDLHRPGIRQLVLAALSTWRKENSRQRHRPTVEAGLTKRQR